MNGLVVLASAMAGMVAIAGCSDEDDPSDVEDTGGDGSDYGSFDERHAAQLDRGPGASVHGRAYH